MMDFVLGQNGLKDEELMRFKASLQATSLKKGTHLITSGQLCRYIALVESGYLRTYHLAEAGNEVTTEFSSAGSFCSSYYSFYTHKPAFEYIEAITDCELYLLSYNALQQLYANSFAMNVFGRTVLEKACIERDLRLKKIMHLSAMEKYQWFLGNYPGVYKVCKLGAIASFLGMKQETLSRVRRRMIS